MFLRLGAKPQVPAIRQEHFEQQQAWWTYHSLPVFVQKRKPRFQTFGTGPSTCPLHGQPFF